AASPGRFALFSVTQRTAITSRISKNTTAGMTPRKPPMRASMATPPEPRAFPSTSRTSNRLRFMNLPLGVSVVLGLRPAAGAWLDAGEFVQRHAEGLGDPGRRSRRDGKVHQGGPGPGLFPPAKLGQRAPTPFPARSRGRRGQPA